jgi:hypothetical protein
MAYAAYREPPGAAFSLASPVGETVFQVLDVTVASVDACRVRRALAACQGVGVLRCEPLLHSAAAWATAAPRVRLMVRLPLLRYAEVLHCLLECVPDGEIGALTSWRAHLQRCGVAHGG